MSETEPEKNGISKKKENKVLFEKGELQSMEKKIEKNQSPQNKFFFPEARFLALFSKKETKPIILSIEDKKEIEIQPVIPQPIKLVELVKTEKKSEKVEFSLIKENEAQTIKQTVENIQPIKPAEPEGKNVICQYIKNGKTTMVIRDETFSAFKILESSGITIEKESDYKRKQQLEFEAEQKQYEPYLKRIEEADSEIAKINKEMVEDDQKRQLEAEVKMRKFEEHRETMRVIQVETAKLERDKVTAELDHIKSLKNRDNSVMRTNPNSISPFRASLGRDDTKPVVADVVLLSSKSLTIKNRYKPRNVLTNFKVPSHLDESNDYDFDEAEFKDLDDDEDD